MPHSPSHISRRGFLALAAGTAASLRPAGRAAPGQTTSAPATQPAPATRPALPETSTVDIVTSDRVVDGRRVRRHRLREMIDRVVMAQSRQTSIKAAWGHYVPPRKRVLLKMSDLVGSGLGTEEAMLAALLASMTAGGIRRGDILVADPRWAALEKGLAPVRRGFSDRTVRLGDTREDLRRYLEDTDVIVNVPSLTDHPLAGLSCAMVNVSLPLIRHPARYHGPKLHETIVSVCESPQVFPRIALTIANVLRCLCDGAPIVREARVAYGNSVWAATDMVAVDRLALEWLRRRRRAKRLDTLIDDGRPATFIDIAGRRGLGHADLRRISPQRQLI